ncbi:hypothetical protein J19TS2_32810 [Cohnella xylanilytica]|uniref:acyl carrier protein n=1 Tax=Cohnella xylanilytica TaxID=557555 RepID=UPI001AFE4727|nr:phosphopantetheine-binding protein [Cohnella xylanilytica]GIO13726.1 hypothetical protein J19TS2_32810 [Cohnella xylanilytica]
MSLTYEQQEVERFVKERMADLISRPELAAEFAEHTALEEVGIDSVLMVSLMVQLEQKFDIFYEDDELTSDNFATVGIIVERLMKKLSVAEARP